jgi:hypothetical protein
LISRNSSRGDETAEFLCREYFGFGNPPGFPPLFVAGGFIETMWAPTLQQLADVMGVEIEETRVVYETDGLDHDVETGFGTMEAGIASVLHFEYQALSGGKPLLSASTAWPAGTARTAGAGSGRTAHRISPSASPSKATPASRWN